MSCDAEKARQAEETRRARIAAAKLTLQEARSLTEARYRAQRLEAAEKGVRRCEGEERFKNASASSQEAAHRAQRIATEAEEAAQAVEDTSRAIEKASKELDSLFQESAAM